MCGRRLQKSSVENEEFIRIVIIELQDKLYEGEFSTLTVRSG
jgi:hypothetical protein